MSDETTHYAKPSRNDYIRGAECIERNLARYEVIDGGSVFDDIILDAMRARAKMFRELAETAPDGN